MIFTRRQGLASVTRFATAFAVCCSLGLAFAQPLKPIKILVGFPPGGGTDAAARILAEKLKDELGVPVIVENKPCAGGWFCHVCECLRGVWRNPGQELLRVSGMDQNAGRQGRSGHSGARLNA